VITVPPTNVAVPFAGWVTIATVVNTPENDVKRLISVAVWYGTVAVAAVEPGGGGGTTVTVTVDTFEVPPGPVAVYVNESGPK
jgi:hypothetical protein